MSDKKQQFKVTISGRQYYTFDGADENSVKLVHQKNGGKNLIEAAKVKMDTVCSMVMKNVSINPVHEIPEVTVESSRENNNNFIVSGKATIDGVEYHVDIDATGVHYKALNAPEPEPVKEEEPVEEVKEEKPVEEEKEEKPVEDVKEEPADEFKDENQTPTEEQEPVADEEPETTEDAIPEVITESGETFMNAPVDKPVEHMNVGFTFGSRNTVDSLVKKTNTQISRPHRKHTVGFTTNGSMPMPNVSENYRCRPLRSVSITGRPVPQGFEEVQYVAPVKPEPAVAKMPEPTEEEKLMESWKSQSPVNMATRWTPAPEPEEVKETLKVEDEEVKEESSVDDYKAAKEAVRAQMSPEVNAVIGDIPHSMLGHITPFTTKPVDVSSLEKMQDIYCIDNHWMNAGNWYCIDVVKESARYFFNSKLGVSIQIDMKTLKQWKEVVA